MIQKLPGSLYLWCAILIFGAAKQNLKIVDLPIRYQDRTYGSTNIDRWRHGLLLFRMVAIAAFRLKFI